MNISKRIYVYLFLLLVPSWGWAVDLPETGQTSCYDENGTVINCTDTGQDGDVSAGVQWPRPRFFAAEGKVTDYLTGLVWVQDAGTAEPLLPGNCNPLAYGAAVTWSQAFDFIACLNSNGYLGHSDWRLPNINELKSLIHWGEDSSSAWLMSLQFSNVQSIGYWSSTTYLEGNAATQAKTVDFTSNDILNFSKDQFARVWPVRSDVVNGGFPAEVLQTGQDTCYDSNGSVIICAGTGQDGEFQVGAEWTATTRFDDQTDGTVVDAATGLMWVQDLALPGVSAICDTTLNWSNALAFIQCLNNEDYKGHSDWRLPNVIELASLVDASVAGGSTVVLPSDHPFLNINSVSEQWTSTSDESSTNNALTFNISNGLVSNVRKVVAAGNVWPVRDGGGFVLGEDNGYGSICFIATAAYGSYMHADVEVLRDFRDEYLLTNALGRQLVAFYYRHSPAVAHTISQSDSLRATTRVLLTPVIYSVKYPVLAMFSSLLLMSLMLWRIVRIRKTRTLLEQ